MREINLREDEKITCEAVKSNVVKYVCFLIMGIVGFLILNYVMSLVSMTIVDIVKIILLFAIEIIIFAYPIIRIKNTELCYTNKRVIGKTGIFIIDTLNTPLSKVNNVHIRKSILGYGTIVIATSSKNYKFKYISNVEELRDKLMEEIEQYEQEKIKVVKEKRTNTNQQLRNTQKENIKNEHREFIKQARLISKIVLYLFTISGMVLGIITDNLINAILGIIIGWAIGALYWSIIMGITCIFENTEKQ